MTEVDRPGMGCGLALAVSFVVWLVFTELFRLLGWL